MMLSQDHPAEPAQLKPMRSILVVEDELLLRLCISEELRQAGYLVYEAAGAEDALTILDNALTILDGMNIDLLITDIRMPGSFDGLGLARRVREEYPQTRIMLLSAHITRETEIFDGLFVKPVRIADLIAGVKKLVPIRLSPP